MSRHEWWDVAYFALIGFLSGIVGFMVGTFLNWWTL